MYIIIYIYIDPRVLHSFSRCIDDYIFLVYTRVISFAIILFGSQVLHKDPLELFWRATSTGSQWPSWRGWGGCRHRGVPWRSWVIFRMERASWASKFGMAFIWLYKWQFFLCLVQVSQLTLRCTTRQDVSWWCHQAGQKKAPVIQDISAFCASTEDLNLMLV